MQRQEGLGQQRGTRCLTCTVRKNRHDQARHVRTAPKLRQRAFVDLPGRGSVSGLIRRISFKGFGLCKTVLSAFLLIV